MTLEEAQEITGLCVRHAMYRLGVVDEAPPTLAPYTLRQLLDANEMVAAENAKPVEGRRTLSMACDARLLAALYVAHHYDPSDLDDATVLAVAGNAAVVVLAFDQLGARP